MGIKFKHIILFFVYGIRAIGLGIKAHLVEVLASLSQTLNTVIWSWRMKKSGAKDQTLSARSYEGALLGIWWCSVAVEIIDRIFFWEPHHCEVSYHFDNEFTYRD
ncbi:hypothetical protein [Paremcibacter congregatus]|uniref:hypothetical protein n=1 Tax=Paremcibacter congregatus TaxID=2043170 RepID=UPI0030ED718C